jgi:nitrile hydratase accessory protein
VYRRNRNIVVRGDGRLVNVARPRGQLFVCGDGCCCGRVEDGFPAVPAALYHAEWERRRLRNTVHLTIGGCLGPCALANVALLLFDGQALWFRELNDAPLVLALFDYIETLLATEQPLPPPPALAALQFTASAWQPRADGLPVDDYRPHRPTAAAPVSCLPAHDRSRNAGGLVAVDGGTATTDGATLPDLPRDGAASVPRRNGELVFAAPWEARAFGMAVALSENGALDWEEFRQQLIAEIGAADASGDSSGYYERWLAAFERLLSARGIVAPAELEERAFAFEFGERDEIF